MYDVSIIIMFLVFERHGEVGQGPKGAHKGEYGGKKNRLVNKMGLANGGWVTGWVTRIKKPTLNPTYCHS